MKRRNIIILSGFAVVFLALLCYGFLLFYAKPIAAEQKELLYIDKDDSVDSVFCKLEKQFGMSTRLGLRLLADWRGYEVKTGAYKMKTEYTVVDIYRMLSRGNQTPVKMVVPSTRTVDKVIGVIAAQVMADSMEIVKVVTDSAELHRMGFDVKTLPALFIPNTYEVYWNMNGASLVKRLKKEYDRYWNKKRVLQASKIGLTPVEVSILASIVDEETAVNREKPMIAGLYLNRLKKGMLLQADPTVKFAMKDFALKRILFKHLETDSPYNTYKYVGLPPGPIRVPSVQGLESVLNPAHHSYLYMCAKEDFSGTHNFAVTLGQHMVNARKYQNALNKLTLRR